MARIDNLNTAYDSTLTALTAALTAQAAAVSAYNTAVANAGPSYNIDGQQVDHATYLSGLASQMLALGNQVKSLNESLAKLRQEISDEEGPFEIRTNSYSP